MYTYKNNVAVAQSRIRPSIRIVTVASIAATIAMVAGGVLAPFSVAHASGGSTSTTTAVSATSGSQKIDTIKVSKAYTDATATGGGVMLLKAASSDASAQLFAYRPDGTLIGEVQNGGGSKYGGTVMPYQAYDPGTITFTSTSGGSITVPTTPFQI